MVETKAKQCEKCQHVYRNDKCELFCWQEKNTDEITNECDIFTPIYVLEKIDTYSKTNIRISFFLYGLILLGHVIIAFFEQKNIFINIVEVLAAFILLYFTYKKHNRARKLLVILIMLMVLYSSFILKDNFGTNTFIELCIFILANDFMLFYLNFSKNIVKMFDLKILEDDEELTDIKTEK